MPSFFPKSSPFEENLWGEWKLVSLTRYILYAGDDMKSSVTEIETAVEYRKDISFFGSLFDMPVIRGNCECTRRNG